MFQEVSKWLGMAYNLLIDGVYWGYNPLTNLLLTSWDILVCYIPAPSSRGALHVSVTGCQFTILLGLRTAPRLEGAGIILFVFVGDILRILPWSWDSSPSNHQFGEYFVIFSTTEQQIKVFEGGFKTIVSHYFNLFANWDGITGREIYKGESHQSTP